MPFRIEDEARARGANYIQGGLFKAFAVRDMHLITGQQQYTAARWPSSSSPRGGLSRARRQPAVAPVSAQRALEKRSPHVASRIAINPARPHHTPAMPQPSCSASSATGT